MKLKKKTIDREFLQKELNRLSERLHDGRYHTFQEVASLEGSVLTVRKLLSILGYESELE
jgi:hypothetical protein